MTLLNLKAVSEKTGIPLGTLRFYIRTGNSPFNLRQLASGRIVISEEDLQNNIDALPDYICTKERLNNGQKQKR